MLSVIVVCCISRAHERKFLYVKISRVLPDDYSKILILWKHGSVSKCNADVERVNTGKLFEVSFHIRQSRKKTILHKYMQQLKSAWQMHSFFNWLYCGDESDASNRKNSSCCSLCMTKRNFFYENLISANSCCRLNFASFLSQLYNPKGRCLSLSA